MFARMKGNLFRSIDTREFIEPVRKIIKIRIETIGKKHKIPFSLTLTMHVDVIQKSVLNISGQHLFQIG